MKKQKLNPNYLAVLVTILLINFNVNAQTNILGGAVSGTWNLSESPYIVQDSIIIPDGQTLTIEQGVTVNFQGHKIDIQGTLHAVGSASDSIFFEDARIYLINTNENNDTSKFMFCSITKGVFFIENFSKVHISNSVITDNDFDRGPIISCINSNSVITNNNISHNTAYYGSCGIYCYSSNPIIGGNIIADNSSQSFEFDGIACFNGSSPQIINNTIANNHCYLNTPTVYGIKSIDSSPLIVNNIIYNNQGSVYGAGIYCNNSTPEISYNNIYNYGSFNEVEYCDETLCVNTMINANGDSCDINYNIKMSPMFVDSINGDYNLQEASPCIDAGVNNVVELQVDNKGNVRIWDGNNNGTAIVDMGVYEYNAPIFNNTNTILHHSKINIYPNPSNNNITIESIDGGKIDIITMQGVIIKELSTRDKIIKIDISDLAIGFYLIKIRRSKEVIVKTLIKE